MTLQDEWWFSYRNVVAEADLDGGDEIADFEPSNVIDRREDSVWRVSGPTMTLKGSLAQALEVQALLIRVYPGVSWGSGEQAVLGLSNADVDSNELGEWTIPLDADQFTGCVVFLNDAAVQAQFFRLTLPARDLEYIHLGPLFLPRHYSRGADAAPDFTDAIEASLFTASKSVQSGPQIDRFTGQFEAWSDSEYLSWLTFVRTVRKTEPFAFGVSQTTQLAQSYIAHLAKPVQLRQVGTRYLGQIQLEAFR